MNDAIAQLVDRAVGRGCAITRHEYSWGFRFEGHCWIMVECPWRIVSDGGITFASRDDGHHFGLPTPIDGEAKARHLIGNLRLVSLRVAESTADLQLQFENDTIVDVFNNSVGYEAWQAGFQTGRTETQIVGGGGGQISVFAHHDGPDEI